MSYFHRLITENLCSRNQEVFDFFYPAQSVLGGEVASEDSSFGVADPDAVVNGDSNCWLTMDVVQQREAAHLVITDFTMVNDPIAANEFLKKLLPISGATYRLFVWQNGEIIEIKSLTDFNLIDYSKINPASEKTIREILLKKYGINKQQSSLVNWVWTQKLQDFESPKAETSYLILQEFIAAPFTMSDKLATLNEMGSINIRLSIDLFTGGEPLIHELKKHSQLNFSFMDRLAFDIEHSEPEKRLFIKNELKAIAHKIVYAELTSWGLSILAKLFEIEELKIFINILLNSLQFFGCHSLSESTIFFELPQNKMSCNGIQYLSLTKASDLALFSRLITKFTNIIYTTPILEQASLEQVFSTPGFELVTELVFYTDPCDVLESTKSNFTLSGLIKQINKNNISRLKKLKIAYPYRHENQEISNETECAEKTENRYCFEMLEEFEIKNLYERDKKPVSIILQSSKRLKKISMDCSWLYIDDIILGFQNKVLTTLTSLKLDLAQIRDMKSVVNFLAQCKSLKSLSLLTLKTIDTVDYHGPQITSYLIELNLKYRGGNLSNFAHNYPRLTKLTVDALDSNFFEFTNNISCESLEELSLKGHKEETIAWTNFFNGKNPIRKLDVINYAGIEEVQPELLDSVTEITLHAMPIMAIDSLIYLLKHAKNLRIINIEPIVSANMNYSDIECLLPFLQRVSIINRSIYGLYTISQDVLIELCRLPNLLDCVKESLLLAASCAKPEITIDKKNSVLDIMLPDGRLKRDQELVLQVTQHFKTLKVESLANKSHPACYRGMAFAMQNAGDEVIFSRSASAVTSKYDDKIFYSIAEMDFSDKAKLAQNSYHGKQRFIFKPNETLSLISVDANEIIDAIYLPSEHLNKLSLQLDPISNMHYLTNLTNEILVIDVNFLLHIPNIKNIHRFKNTILERLIAKYHAFNEGSKDIEARSSIELLKTIADGNEGACRHRAQALIWEFMQLQEQDPSLKEIEIQLIANDCHAFIEYRLYRRAPWIHGEVGGHRTKLRINREMFPEQQRVPVVLADLENKADKYLSPVRAIADRHFSHKSNLKQLLDDCIKAENYIGKNILLRCQLNLCSDILANLQMQAAQVRRPIFYVDKPADLACFLKVFKLIEFKKSILKLVKPPVGGSALYEFLSKHKDNKPMLVINWGSFLKWDFTKHHNFVDMPRSNPLLPKDLTIFSLYPEDKSGLYRGEDFTSRHQDSIECQDVASMPLTIETIAEDAELDVTKVEVINLHHSLQWSQKLIGCKRFTEKYFSFLPGKLLLAIKAGKSVVLRNAPWADLSFQWFWRELLHTRELSYFGQTIHLPKNFTVKKQDMNYAEYYAKVLADISATSSADSFCVNPSNFRRLFSNFYTHPKTHVFSQAPGWLEPMRVQAERVITLLVTSNLSIDMWDELFAWADTREKQFAVYFSPGVFLPAIFGTELHQKTHSIEVVDSKHCEVYEMAEVAHAIQNIEKKWPKAKVINATELTAANCFYQDRPKYHKKKLLNHSIASEIWQDLIAGKDIVLYGQFSQALCDGLAPIILQNQIRHNGKKETIKGKLILVAEEATHFNYAKVVSLNLPITSRALPVFTEEVINSDDLSETVCEQAITARAEVMAKALFENQLLLVEGETAVGKSTFLNIELPKKYTVFKEEQLIDWLTAGSNHETDYQILVIEEANLKAKQWQMLHDLLKNKRSVFYNGKYYPLSKQHRVVFAGNNKKYQAGRRKLEIVEQHAAKLTLERLPPAVLYQKQLKQLRPDFIGEKLWKGLCERLLYFYKHYPNAFTPREIEAIAHLIICNTRHMTRQDFREYAAYCTYKMYTQKAVVNEAFTAEILNKFEVEKLALTKFRLKATEAEIKYYAEHDFVYTNSRHECYEALHDALAMREAKLKQQQDVPGLSGIVISGPSGIGKSVWAHLFLQQHGFVLYQEGDDITSNTFFDVAPDLSFERKKALLQLAKAHQSVVLMDEINAPLTEHLLNEITGGQGIGEHGMTIIGLMNDASLDGRDNSSDAFYHRFLKVELKHYHEKELLAILSEKYPNIPSHLRIELVKIFLLYQQHAQHKGQDMPTIRELNSAAEELNTQQKIKQINLAALHARFTVLREQPVANVEVEECAAASLQRSIAKY
jgi:hypothetical protein